MFSEDVLTGEKCNFGKNNVFVPGSIGLFVSYGIMNIRTEYDTAVFGESCIYDRILHLKNITKTEDGVPTAIKEYIDILHQNRTTSLKEQGKMYDQYFNPLNSFNAGPHSTSFASGGQPQYFILVHMHQDKFEKNGELKDTNPVHSDTDIVYFLENFDYTNNRRATNIVVSRLGVFAIMVNNKNYARDTLDKISDSNSEEGRNFGEQYDNLVMTPYLQDPTSGEAILGGLISFVSTHQVNGHPIGISLYQAIYEGNNIVDWVKL